MEIYVTSDTHFFGEDYLRRMNLINPNNEDNIFHRMSDNEKIQNWNEIVDDEDHVFVIGDFVQTYDHYYWNIYRDIDNRLNGKKTFIVGNHEYNAILRREGGVPENEVMSNINGNMLIHYPIIINDILLLSHMPYHVLNTEYINLYGHLQKDQGFFHNDYNHLTPFYYNCCFDINGYKPILLKDILKEIINNTDETEYRNDPRIKNFENIILDFKNIRITFTKNIRININRMVSFDVIRKY